MMEEHINNRLQLRSELAREIISNKAGPAEKWALPAFGGVLFIIFLASWMIKYPDIIQSGAKLSAINAPKEIVIRQEGRLTRLLAHNDDQVRKGQVFGWIESTASHREVLKLSGRVDSAIDWVQGGQCERAAGLLGGRFDNLGEVQKDYKDFMAALQLFNDYFVNGFYLRRMQLLRSDVQGLEETKANMQDQLALTREDLDLSRESFEMNKTLFEDKVISKKDYSTEKSTFIGKRMTLPQLRSSLLSNEAQMRDKTKELGQLEHDMSQEKTVFLQALYSLKSALDDWKKRFVLIAPESGRLYFVIPLQENQFLTQGRLAGYIMPEGNHYYAETYLPQAGFGRVDTGLKVQLRFDAYPYQETGFVGGTLNYISGIAADSGFLATIRLDSGLVTNNHISIQYKSGLKAQAIVITKNMRLLERLYYSVVKSVSLGKR